MFLVTTVRSLATGIFPAEGQGGVVQLQKSGSENTRSPSSSTSTDEASISSVPSSSDVTEEYLESLLGRESSVLDSAQEKRGLREMLIILSDDEKKQVTDKYMFIRHFRAEKGDVHKAVKSLRSALQWRKDFGVAALLAAIPVGEYESTNEDLAEMMRIENETGKIYVRGYDRQGRALMYMRPAWENTNNELDNMRHLVWNLEKAIACTARRSRELSKDGATPLDKVNLVIDYVGFKLKNAPPMSTTKFTLDILQHHYPEFMFRVYFLHPPMVFRAFWNIVRPFIDPVTKQKIVFCAGKQGMQPLLDAVEDLHKLEPVAGGTQPVRDFNSTEYLNLPFDTSFDE